MADPKTLSTFHEISRYGFIIQSVISLIAAGLVYYLRYLILKDVTDNVETERNYRITDDKELDNKINKVSLIVSGLNKSVEIHQKICPRMRGDKNGDK